MILTFSNLKNILSSVQNVKAYKARGTSSENKTQIIITRCYFVTSEQQPQNNHQPTFHQLTYGAENCYLPVSSQPYPHSTSANKRFLKRKILNYQYMEIK